MEDGNPMEEEIQAQFLQRVLGSVEVLSKGILHPVTNTPRGRPAVAKTHGGSLITTDNADPGKNPKIVSCSVPGRLRNVLRGSVCFFR